MPGMPSNTALSNRRFLVLLCAAAGFLFFLFVGFSRNSRGGSSSAPESYSSTPIHHITVDDAILKGDAIMGNLGNETLKAELGRSSWKLFHTMMARFPDTPTQDEQTALSSYIHLFARLYPCGECAGHFRAILNKFPPQTKTRSTTAAWACHVHNEVNKSLNKELFDCSKIGDFYDCGCAEDGDEKRGDKAKDAEKVVQEVKDDETLKREMQERLEYSLKHDDDHYATTHDPEELLLEKEGLTLGGVEEKR